MSMAPSWRGRKAPPHILNEALDIIATVTAMPVQASTAKATSVACTKGSIGTSVQHFAANGPKFCPSRGTAPGLLYTAAARTCPDALTQRFRLTRA